MVVMVVVVAVVVAVVVHFWQPFSLNLHVEQPGWTSSVRQRGGPAAGRGTGAGPAAGSGCDGSGTAVSIAFLFSFMQDWKKAVRLAAFVLSWQFTLHCPSPRSLRYSCSAQNRQWKPQLVPSVCTVSSCLSGRLVLSIKSALKICTARLIAETA